MQQICVQTLGGRTLDLSLANESTTLDLKNQVKAVWHVSVDAQTLVVDDYVLQLLDGMELIAEKAQCNDGDPATVTLITATQISKISTYHAELISQLRSEDSRTRSKAVSAVISQSAEYNEREMEMLCDHIHGVVLNGSAGAKKAGLEVLAKILPKGHSTGIDIALLCLSDHRDLVRLQAVECVSALAPRGHERTISFARKLSKSRCLAVQAAAIMVLGEVAYEDSRGVMDLLTSYTLCEDVAVQIAVHDACRSIWAASAGH